MMQSSDGLLAVQRLIERDQLVPSDLLLAAERTMNEYSAAHDGGHENATTLSELVLHAERLRQLQASTAALADVRSPDEVADVAANIIAAEVGANRSMVVLRDGDAMFVVRQRGFDGSDHQPAVRTMASPTSAFATVITAGDVVPIPTITRSSALFASQVRTEPPEDARSEESVEMLPDGGAVVPIIADGQPIGAAAYLYATPRACSREERMHLLALGRQIGSALVRTRALEAERAARRAAEQANLAKSRLVAAISHELRTPLSSIAGYAQLLRMGAYGELTHQQGVALTRIERNEQHLMSLVNQVLDLAKIEAGHTDFQLMDVALDEAVAAVLPMLEPQLAAREQTLHTDLPPGRYVLADAEKLQQILINLLSNAMKFSPHGSTITVDFAATRTVTRAHLLRVTDAGIGIPRLHHESIFEPFIQLHRPGSPTDGSGLGLAISRELARAMGGDLRVRSVNRKGSTFTLSLPKV